MKEIAKVFSTITALLLGGLFVADYIHNGFYGGQEGEAFIGIILLAAGFTAVWVRRNKNRK